ncbi:MAG TPA: MFS transporter [Xanthobacteraceae bacterium]|nr:MFS transporter [Xanthobacteraceae bacterium]
MRAPDPHRPPSAGQLWLCLALLWLAGNGLRITILAVPPVIPLLSADLHISATQVGILGGLPAVLFACAAIPGSLLIARFGALSTLVIGLLATALGSALRGVVPDVALLYAATVVTAFGVAVMQPALPPLVRAWLPHRIGFGTAVYTNGLLVGEIIPVLLTGLVVLPLVGNSWRWAFVAWAVPVALIAVVIALLAPRPGLMGFASVPRLWWPNWRDPLIWRLGLMLGSVNALYFATNTFIPYYFNAVGRDGLIGPALVALNAGQVPASFVLLAVVGELEHKVWPYVVCGLISIACVAGIVFGNGAVVIGSAAVLGFAAAAVLILMLALPPLLSKPDDVHRTAAAMFTISYSLAVITPVVSGVVWDLSGVPATAFLPIGLIVLLLIGLAPKISVPRDAV